MRRRWTSFQRWFSSAGEFCSVEPEEVWTHFSISNVVSWNQTHELFSFFFFIFVFFAADGLQGRPQVIDAQERSHQPQGLHGLLLKDLGIFLLHLQEADPFSKLGVFLNFSLPYDLLASAPGIIVNLHNMVCHSILHSWPPKNYTHQPISYTTLVDPKILGVAKVF